VQSKTKEGEKKQRGMKDQQSERKKKVMDTPEKKKDCGKKTKLRRNGRRGKGGQIKQELKGASERQKNRGPTKSIQRSPNSGRAGNLISMSMAEERDYKGNSDQMSDKKKKKPGNG